MTRASLLGVALALGLLGCALAQTAPSVDDPGEAVGGTEAMAVSMVETWLDLQRTRSGDYGWSLLYPNIQTDVINGEDGYRRAVERADWSDFHYTIESVAVNDGEYRVRLSMTTGPAGLPRHLVDWGLIQVGWSADAPDSHGLVVVRIAPGGSPSGIQATG